MVFTPIHLIFLVPSLILNKFILNSKQLRSPGLDKSVARRTITRAWGAPGAPALLEISLRSRNEYVWGPEILFDPDLF